jgi:hypothetical protein
VFRQTAAALAIALAGTGCGARASSQNDREWDANARGVVEQLRGDVVEVAGFDRLALARRGLRDESELYGLLVSYTDFGGCRHMVAALGAEPPGRRRASDLLRRTCVHLRRADDLFVRAVAGSAPRLLVAATREVLAGVPLLDRAALELARRS